MRGDCHGTPDLILIDAIVFGDGCSECDLLTFYPSAAVETEIRHELKKVRDMNFVRLHWSSHDGTGSQKIGKPLHVCGVEHVYFQIKFPANVKTVHRHAFAECDASDVGIVFWIMRVSAICKSH